jgi:hypothetical protein
VVWSVRVMFSQSHVCQKIVQDENWDAICRHLNALWMRRKDSGKTLIMGARVETGGSKGARGPQMTALRQAAALCIVCASF